MHALRRRILLKTYELFDLVIMVGWFVIGVAVEALLVAHTLFNDFIAMRIKTQNFVLFIGFLFAWHLIFRAFSLYQTRRLSSRRQEILDVLKAISLGVAAAAQLSAWFWKKGEKSEHRFEVSTLKRMFPLFGIYALLLSIWPTTLPLAHWPNGLDYKRLSELQRIVFTARFIEVIAAFTLLGYMVAGLLGRKDESGLKTAGWVFGSSVMFSIVTALLRDFLSGPLPFLLEVALLTVAALYGAVIYRLQLEAFRQASYQAARQASWTADKLDG